MKYLTKTPISSNSFLSPPSNFTAGASVVFFGMIRDRSAGKEVLYLEYEAFEVMAEKMIEHLLASAFDQWPLEKIRLLHRLGRVNLGEIAVAIEVRAAHRDEAYRASRYLIDEIKHNVPIWKKEYFADETSEWGICNHIPLGTVLRKEGQVFDQRPVPEIQDRPCSAGVRVKKC